MVLALQGVIALRQFQAERMVGGVVGLTLTRELAFVSTRRSPEQLERTLRVEIADRSGAVTTYLVKDIVIDKGIADAKFEFSAPKGAEIIDLR